MKRLLSIVLIFVMVFSALAVNVTTALADDNNINETFLDRVKQDYDLVWSDEFNSDTLDLKKWQIDGQTVERNSEIQVYADSMEDGNLEFDGECAVIVPKKETRTTASGKTFKYTSAEISTQGKQAWKYGYFEIRAKVSCGQNLVPAIWMMGYDYPSGTCDWPHSGEIDIIERHGDNSVYSSLHYAEYGKTYPSHISASAGEQSFSHKLNEEFHNYWLYWTDKYLIVGVDDNMHQIIDITSPDLSQSYRSYEHWLILNVALGMFGNKVNDAEEDLWKMWIDHVRVYQLEEDKLYENYQAFSVLDLMHNGLAYNYGKTVSTLRSKQDLAFTMQDELEPGKYDVYAEIGNQDTESYIDGVKTNEFSAVDHGIEVGNQVYVGSVDLQEKTPFDISFKAKNGSAVTAEKLIFIKTDETKTTPVVVTKDNGVNVSTYKEVSTETELVNALNHFAKDTTIKLTNDITFTKRVDVLEGCTLDLNGKTLTCKGGYFVINKENDPLTIKNGKIVMAENAWILVHTRENNYKAYVVINDVDFDITTTSSGYMFNHSYGSISATCSNCEFTFDSAANKLLFTREGATFNNCKFKLNNTTPIYVNNNRTLALNSCEINNTPYLFKTDNALTGGGVTIANTTVNNVGAISNFAENEQYFTVATNNTLENADGKITVTCEHNFVDGDCTTPTHCEYCNYSTVSAPGHKLVTKTTPATCFDKGEIVTSCEVCNTTFKTKKIPVLEHNYELAKTIEASCTKEGYRLWACTNCEMTQQRSYNGDGKPSLLAHTFDESKTVVVEPTKTMGGYTSKYCTTCQKTIEVDLKLSITDNNREYTVEELQNSSRLLGRAYKESGEIVMAMSGSGAEFNINVTGDVKVKLNNVVHETITHYLGVMIDDDYENYKLIEISSGENEVTVATGLTGKHKITLWHPNEYSYSTYRLKSLTFNGSKAEAPEKKQYTIDFYGDSITVGQGNVPLGEDGSYKPYTSNAFDTYAGVASRKLGADFNICAASGYGMAYGFGENTNPPTGIISKIYDYASPKDNVIWDYTAYTPDLAVVSLGQNDQSHTSNVGDVDYKQALRDRVKEIIEKIRTNDENVPVVFVGGIMGDFGNEFINMRRTISEVMSENGYENIYFKYLLGDSSGGNYHPSAAAHKSCGETLAQFIGQLDLLNKDTRVAETLIADFDEVSTTPSHCSTSAEVVESPFEDNHGKVLKVDATKESSSVSFNLKDMPEDTVGIKFDLRITKNATMGFLGKDSAGSTLFGSQKILGQIGTGSWNHIVADFDLAKCSTSDIVTFTISTTWTKADTMYIDNISYLTVKSAHIPKEGFDKVVEPTCIENGYTEHVCADCGETYKTNIIPANGNHTPDVSKNKVFAPNLVEQGYTIFTCSICEEEYNGDYTPTLLETHSLGLNTLEGASIRLNDKTGLRFYTEVDEQTVNELEALGCTVELGTLIAPYDFLNNNDLTFELGEGRFIDVKYNSTTYYSDATGFKGIVGSIVNIKESTASNPTNGNVLRYFVGRGYAKITDEKGNTEIIYADYNKSTPRSLGLVAFRFKVDFSDSIADLYPAFAEKVDKWALTYKLAQDAFESDKW